MSNLQSPEVWPPTRSSNTRVVNDSNTRTPSGNHNASSASHVPETPQNVSFIQPSASLTSKRSKKIFRNGFEQSAPKPLSYTPYQPLTRRADRKKHTFELPNIPDLQPIKPHPGLNASEWNELAIASGLIPNGATVHGAQMQCANFVLGKKEDIFVIAPTGWGKSNLWKYPLVARKSGISIVVTPYTCLGLEGAEG